jgi:hypothetical protein
VRCPRCGSAVAPGARFCNICGTPALDRVEYGRKAGLFRRAQELQKKHGVPALVGIWMSVLVLIAVLVLLLLIVGDVLLDDWWYFANETLPKVLLVAVPVLLGVFTLAWWGSRSYDMKKAGITGEQYRRALEELKTLPKGFFDGMPGGYPPGSAYAGGPAPKKTMSQGALIAMLSVILVITVGASVWIGTDGVGLGDTVGAVDGGHSDGGSQRDYLDGKVYAAEGSSSGGMYTMGEALYFEDGSVYFGTEGMTAGEIKDSSSLFAPEDVSYSIDGTTIYITGGGGSAQYTYDEASDTIRAGGTVLYRVY